MSLTQKSIKFDQEALNMLNSLSLWYGYDNITEAVNECIKESYENQETLVKLEQNYQEGFKTVIEINVGLNQAPLYEKIFEVLKPTINFLKTNAKSDFVTQLKEVEIASDILRNIEGRSHEIDTIIKNSIEGVVITLLQKDLCQTRNEALDKIIEIGKMCHATNSHIAFTLLQESIMA